ncbi:MAG: protoporphyrinogen oxidase [Actinobacteria bacterium]|nr:protoporphyrinogen oxidase [Actinomycetota bacterium]MCG2808332.1 protoporphyrinogen oxidase [Coriobacteriia bacterium]
MRNIIIIGGGAAGLGAAYKVKRAADEGHDVGFTLIEKDARVGGKIASERVADEWDGADGAEFIVDGGPDCFLTSKPAVHRVAKAAGVFDGELPSDESRKKTLILSRGNLYEMPDGVMMFAPTKFVPFATTGLFSWPGKIRMGMDLFVPKKKLAPGELNDETLEHFIVRRMGQECLDRLAEPLVGGVHASDPKQMSLAATFPNLLEMEQKHGSMLKGFLAARKMVEQMKKKYPLKPGDKPKTFFTSFADGMQSFTEAMADAAGRESIRTGVSVSSISRDGDIWTVALDDGSTVTGDAVIVATEAWAAEPLVRSVDTAIADALAGIPSSTSATVSIGFRADEIGIDMDAFGVLCPQKEKRALMAATFSSTKWPGRAPEGKVLMRGFVGGPQNQAIMENSDEELIGIVLKEMRSILGVKGVPLFARVYRWHLGMPQYTMGHLGRVETIEQRSAGIKGLALAGGSYRGVGIPNCIESGERAVSKVTGEWDIELAEDAVEEKRVH